MKLKDKVAIITGAGRGIGLGIAQRLVADGVAVVVADVVADWAGQVAESIQKAGGRALPFTVDVSDPIQVAEMVSACQREFGRVDILVNNAAIAGLAGPFLEMKLDVWQRTLDVNLTGAFLCSQAAARSMVDHGIRGSIVNIGSINSFGAEKGAPHYVATKGGVLGFTKALAVELAPYGIRANMVAPGAISNERTEPIFSVDPYKTAIEKGTLLGRPGTVAEIGAAVAFLCSDDASYITGTSLLADGGMLAYLRYD